MAFYKGDTDGDQSLSWDEFLIIVPTVMKDHTSEVDLRLLFDSVDLDKSGEISLDECASSSKLKPCIPGV